MKAKKNRNEAPALEVSKSTQAVMIVVLSILSLVFLMPIFVVLMNSFKGKFYISDAPFALPDGETFAGLTNYIDGVSKTGLPSAFCYSLFITVFSVLVIVFFTSMIAWYITRVKTWWTKMLYYMFAFAMIVPFQMVMFPMSKIANILRLDNPVGILVVYLGFGAGLSVFMFCGFVKAVPIEMEEAAMIDGSSPIKMFFLVVFPMLKPTAITIAILNAMWIWNDYLLPYLLLGTDYMTIPIAIQYLQGGYGSIDMGAMMAMLVLAMIPIIVFYLLCQKHIIKGVTAGAVKG